MHDDLLFKNTLYLSFVCVIVSRSTLLCCVVGRMRVRTTCLASCKGRDGCRNVMWNRGEVGMMYQYYLIINRI